jgi:hypothetical protein
MRNYMRYMPLVSTRHNLYAVSMRCMLPWFSMQAFMLFILPLSPAIMHHVCASPGIYSVCPICAVYVQGIRRMVFDVFVYLVSNKRINTIATSCVRKALGLWT